jgi:hypothetical protein
MISFRNASRHLYVDQPVDNPIATNDLPNNKLDGTSGHRPVDPELVQGSVQAVQMPGHIDDLALPDFTHLINAIGKLITAILYVHRSIGMPNILAIYIGDPAHGPSKRNKTTRPSGSDRSFDCSVG